MQCVQDRYDSTDCNMFIEACGDLLDELTDVICSYVTFCRDVIIPSKKVKTFPDNKPWVGKIYKMYLPVHARDVLLNQVQKLFCTQGAENRHFKGKTGL